MYLKKRQPLIRCQSYASFVQSVRKKAISSLEMLIACSCYDRLKTMTLDNSPPQSPLSCFFFFSSSSFSFSSSTSFFFLCFLIFIFYFFLHFGTCQNPGAQACLSALLLMLVSITIVLRNDCQHMLWYVVTLRSLSSMVSCRKLLERENIWSTHWVSVSPLKTTWRTKSSHYHLHGLFSRP